MNKILKSGLFIIIFIIIYFIFSYLLLPKESVSKYGMYKTSLYEILGEKENTIDSIIIGDSLVYSSVSPMEIYNKYGFTVFDCSIPALILPDAYEYLKIALETQKPKVVIIEPNMFFRNLKNSPWYNKPIKILKNSLPLITYHNNWKKILFSNNSNSLVNANKGYIKNTNVVGSKNINYMRTNSKKDDIPEENYKYIKQIISDCKKNNIKLIFLGIPSQKSWNYKKHKKVEEIAKKYNLSYINLNLNEIMHINWKKETKDKGYHLNDTGALKVSDYLGNYLKDLNILKNHKNEKGFEEWDNAAHYYFSN